MQLWSVVYHIANGPRLASAVYSVNVLGECGAASVGLFRVGYTGSHRIKLNVIHVDFFNHLAVAAAAGLIVFSLALSSSIKHFQKSVCGIFIYVWSKRVKQVKLN